jgi:hypothetical protein
MSSLSQSVGLSCRIETNTAARDLKTMKRSHLLNRTSGAVIVLAGLALAGCNRAPTAQVQQAPAPTAALALSDSAAPPLVAAPPVNALPSAPPARIGRLQNRGDGYAFADRGYAMSHAFADAPPDYTFDYQGVRPWVWQADDRSIQVVEPCPGGQRYYYYRPGEDQPFLIRDPDYSYGYEGGQLVVIYDRGGRTLPDAYVDQRAETAGRYLARARAIYAASQSDQRQAVAAANWRARQTALDADRHQWAAEQSQDDAWRAYHAEHDQDEAAWAAERYRRQAEAARYAQQANDAQAAARFAQAAAVALQLSQGRREGPPQNAPQGDRGRPPFGQAQQGPVQPQGPGRDQARGPAPIAQAPAQNPATPGRPPFGQVPHEPRQPQGPVQTQARGPAPGPAANPGAPARGPEQRPGDRGAGDQARQRVQAQQAEAQARAAGQASAGRQAQAQQQLTAQHAAQAAAQARTAQQAAGRDQQQASQRQHAAEAAAGARNAQQAAERQQATEARAGAAQQAAAQQQAHAQAAQQAAEHQAQAARKAPPVQPPKPPQAQPQPHAAAPGQPKPGEAKGKPERPGDPAHPNKTQPQ